MIGTTLGHFHIEARAGAGGMGEVYRARDTRLDRTVAIKVLPPDLAADPQRRERLKREALAISRLNHPHVCTLYDIGHAESGDGDPVDYLVLEFLEGTPLSDRTAAGPLPLAEALRLAAQVADGLDAAHRLGIVHRDLKPANVMLTAGGAKLLDFGLAKESGGPAGAGSMIATRTVEAGSGGGESITAEGTLLGTLQYMSPEQLHGEPADARSDLFSFGAMLYEMVTGEAPFTGRSQASVIASILEKEPPPLAERAAVAPPALARLVNRCLAKDPEERWQNARDVMHELRFLASGAGADEAAAPAGDGAAGRRRGWLPGLVGGLALLVGLLLGRTLLPGPEPLGNAPASVQPLVRATIPLPEGYRVSGWASPTVAISDDGSTIACVVEEIGSDSGKGLFVRPLGATEWARVPDSEYAEGPEFSPDGRWVLFAVAVSGGARNTPPELRKYSLDSGLTQTVCPVRDFFGADWHEDGTVVWAGQIPKGLWRIPADGGAKENFLPAFRVDGVEKALPVAWPRFVPGGERMLVSLISGAGFGRAALLDPATGDLTELLADTHGAQYLPPLPSASGTPVTPRLAWVDGKGAVLVAPFDPGPGRLTGAPRAVDRGVSLGGASRSVFAVADNGTAVLTRGPILGSGHSPRRVVGITAAKGNLVRLQPGIDPGAYRSVGVSPDGSRLAVEADGTLRIHDASTGARTDLDLGSVEPNGYRLVWSPDDRWIAFRGLLGREAGLDVFVARTDGSGAAVRVFDAESEAAPLTWEPDGSALLVGDFATDGSDRIRVFRAPLPEEAGGPGGEPERVDLGGHNGVPQLDPGGELIAYTQPLGGSTSAFVRTYPALGPKVLLGSGAYRALAWAPDGTSLFAFLADRVVEYRVERDPLTVEEAGTVFEGVGDYHQPVVNPGPLGGFWALENVPGSGIVTEVEVITHWVQHLP